MADVVDVLIIGSGAAGGPFAWSLSTVRGLKIVCLEQGDWVNKPEASESEGQRKRLVTPPPRDGIRYFANGYPYDHSESYWQPVLGNAVGGATLHYGANWSRLHPSDFVLRSLEGVADDWPIHYWDLQPYYDFNDRMVGVSGVPGNPAYPPRTNSLMPAPKLNKGAQILSRGFKKLGWQWWPTERAVITKPHGGRQPCVGGPGSPDCGKTAKNTSDVVHWPEAIRNGVVLKARARVREITINKRGFADGALYYDADGKLQEQKARIVIVACNGIGTPRLLLNSKSARFPQGLANTSGLVGKGLMSHPKAVVEALFEDEDATIQPGGIGLTSEEFYETDRNRGFIGGWWWNSYAAVSAGPVAAALGTPLPSPVTFVPAALEKGGPVSMKNAAPWGRAHHAAVQERYRCVVSLGILTHELPEAFNRVELHPTLTDDMGIPAPKLFYRRGEHTEKTFAFAIERTKELMMAAGASKIISTDIVGAAPGHYLGTARMGTNPERSVVDGWCRSHDVKNLFIIDGSAFATSGATTPTSTIQAIALRTADYIKNNARQLLT